MVNGKIDVTYRQGCAGGEGGTPPHATTTAQIATFVCQACNLGSNCPLTQVREQIDSFCQKWKDLEVLIEYMNCIQLIVDVCVDLSKGRNEALRESIDNKELASFGDRLTSVKTTVANKTRLKDEEARKITSQVNDDLFEHGASSHSEDDRYGAFFSDSRELFWTTEPSADLFFKEVLPRIIEESGSPTENLGSAVLDPHVYEYSMKALGEIGKVSRIDEISDSALEVFRDKGAWGKIPYSKRWKGQVVRGGRLDYLLGNRIELRFDPKDTGRKSKHATRVVSLDLKKAKIMPFGEYELKPSKLEKSGKARKGGRKTVYFTAKLEGENKWFAKISKTLSIVCLATATYEAYKEPDKIKNWFWAGTTLATAAEEIGGETAAGEIAGKFATPLLIGANTSEAIESFGNADYDAGIFHCLQVVGAVATLTPTGVGQVGGAILIAVGTIGAILTQDSKLESWAKNCPAGTNSRKKFTRRGEYLTYVADYYNRLREILLEAEARSEAEEKKRANFDEFLSRLEETSSNHRVFYGVSTNSPSAPGVLHWGEGKTLGALDRRGDNYVLIQGQYQWEQFQGYFAELAFVPRSDPNAFSDDVTQEFADLIKARGISDSVYVKDGERGHTKYKYVEIKVPLLGVSDSEIEPTELKEADKYTISNKIVDILDVGLDTDAFPSGLPLPA